MAGLGFRFGVTSGTPVLKTFQIRVAREMLPTPSLQASRAPQVFFFPPGACGLVMQQLTGLSVLWGRETTSTHPESLRCTPPTPDTHTHIPPL